VIAALKANVASQQLEIDGIRRKYEAVLDFREDGDGIEEGGRLEVLEAAMKEKKGVVRLLDNLLVQRMTCLQTMEKVEGDLRRLKAKRGTEREVKAMVELRKKCKEDIAMVELKLDEVRREDDGCTEMLREVYESVERLTGELFKDLSFKGLMGWGKIKEVGERGTGAKAVERPVLMGSRQIEREFKAKEERGTVDKREYGDIDETSERERMMITSASSVSVGRGAMSGGWIDGEAPERPTTTPVEVLEGGWERKIKMQAGGKIRSKKSMIMRGTGGVEDKDVVEMMERNSLEAKIAGFDKVDGKSNYLPLIGGGTLPNQVSVQRPMTGVEGSQSRQGIKDDILHGQR